MSVICFVRRVFQMKIILFSAVLSKDAWACDAAGKYNCVPQTQTCCRSKVSTTGWQCFPVVTGVCCSDGISICPFGNTCNLRDKKCDKSALSFLQQQAPTTHHTGMQAQLKLVGQEALDFASGFFTGLTFFANLTHSGECQVSDQLAQDIIDISNLVQNITVAPQDTIQQIIVKAYDAYAEFEKTFAACGAYNQEVQTVLSGLKAYVTASGYTTQLAFHTVENISSIQSKAANGASAISAGQYNDAGVAFGDLSKFVAFWDYQ